VRWSAVGADVKLESPPRRWEAKRTAPRKHSADCGRLMPKNLVVSEVSVTVIDTNMVSRISSWVRRVTEGQGVAGVLVDTLHGPRPFFHWSLVD
jgi:hypothetical protein